MKKTILFISLIFFISIEILTSWTITPELQKGIDDTQPIVEITFNECSFAKYYRDSTNLLQSNLNIRFSRANSFPDLDRVWLFLYPTETNIANFGDSGSGIHIADTGAIMTIDMNKFFLASEFGSPIVYQRNGDDVYIVNNLGHKTWQVLHPATRYYSLLANFSNMKDGKIESYHIRNYSDLSRVGDLTTLTHENPNDMFNLKFAEGSPGCISTYRYSKRTFPSFRSSFKPLVKDIYFKDFKNDILYVNILENPSGQSNYEIIATVGSQEFVIAGSYSGIKEFRGISGIQNNRFISVSFEFKDELDHITNSYLPKKVDYKTPKAELFVKSFPVSPENLKLKAPGKNIVFLGWTQSETRTNKVVGFEIQKQISDKKENLRDDEWTTIFRDGESSLDGESAVWSTGTLGSYTAKISGLTPNTEYFFRIRGKNEAIFKNEEFWDTPVSSSPRDQWSTYHLIAKKVTTLDVDDFQITMAKYSGYDNIKDKRQVDIQWIPLSSNLNVALTSEQKADLEYRVYIMNDTNENDTIKWENYSEEDFDASKIYRILEGVKERHISDLETNPWNNEKPPYLSFPEEEDEKGRKIKNVLCRFLPIENKISPSAVIKIVLLFEGRFLNDTYSSFFPPGLDPDLGKDSILAPYFYINLPCIKIQEDIKVMSLGNRRIYLRIPKVEGAEKYRIYISKYLPVGSTYFNDIIFDPDANQFTYADPEPKNPRFISTNFLLKQDNSSYYLSIQLSLTVIEPIDNKETRVPDKTQYSIASTEETITYRIGTAKKEKPLLFIDVQAQRRGFDYDSNFFRANTIKKSDYPISCAVAIEPNHETIRNYDFYFVDGFEFDNWNHVYDFPLGFPSKERTKQIFEDYYSVARMHKGRIFEISSGSYHNNISVGGDTFPINNASSGDFFVGHSMGGLGAAMKIAKAEEKGIKTSGLITLASPIEGASLLNSKTGNEVIDWNVGRKISQAKAFSTVGFLLSPIPFASLAVPVAWNLGVERLITLGLSATATDEKKLASEQAENHFTALKALEGKNLDDSAVQDYISDGKIFSQKLRRLLERGDVLTTEKIVSLERLQEAEEFFLRRSYVPFAFIFDLLSLAPSSYIPSRPGVIFSKNHPLLNEYVRGDSNSLYKIAEDREDFFIGHVVATGGLKHMDNGKLYDTIRFSLAGVSGAMGGIYLAAGTANIFVCPPMSVFFYAMAAFSFSTMAVCLSDDGLENCIKFVMGGTSKIEEGFDLILLETDQKIQKTGLVAADDILVCKTLMHTDVIHPTSLNEDSLKIYNYQDGFIKKRVASALNKFALVRLEGDNK